MAQDSGTGDAGAHEVVGYEVVDRVAHVTIVRPDRRNAMDLEVFDGLRSRAAEVAADPDVGAVVVAGRGGDFSSGIDIRMLGDLLGDLLGDQRGEPGGEGGGDRSTGRDGGQAGDRPGEGLDAAFVARLQAAFTAYEELDVPTIAAVEGCCFGAGLQLAAACHLRAVAPTARFSVMEARWGLVPDLGGTWRLPRLIGLGRATELALTARTLDAEEALVIGLGELSLPAGTAQDAAHELAARLAAGPGALRLIPRLLRENLGRARDPALEAEAAAQRRVVAGPDVGEAVAAHLGSRPPRFVGREP